jgi:acetoin utilization deacetylase AcuC-like enzyme
MKVVYSPAHEEHAPTSQVIAGRILPSPDRPERLSIIRREFERRPEIEFVAPDRIAPRHLLELHSKDYVDFVRDYSMATKPGEAAIPSTFVPTGSSPRIPGALFARRGYYIPDTVTPILHGTFNAALAAVACADHAAQLVLEGERLAYALIRPPGHHAGYRSAGAYCYFNNTAFAAHRLRRHGRVAVLDIDYHHGNGTQALFYQSAGVLTTSIHASPDGTYPFYFGYSDESGRGRGHGRNLNVPLPPASSLQRYRRALRRALLAIQRYRPKYLVAAVGYDSCRYDPNGGFAGILPDSYESIGKDIGKLRLPTVLVQEGGYNLDVLGRSAERFITGIQSVTH